MSRTLFSRSSLTRAALVGAFLMGMQVLFASPVKLPPETDPVGFVSRLLVNEVPFPGEEGYHSEADTQEAMRALLCVLTNRLSAIPSGYTQQQIAATRGRDIIDVITAGGKRGQVDGFYRLSNGQTATDERVGRRITYLESIANRGQPGTFARLLSHAQELAADYLQRHNTPSDPYHKVRMVDHIPATGNGYAWMSDREIYNPGGNFLRIPNELHGAMGGNRFYTLRRSPAAGFGSTK